MFFRQLMLAASFAFVSSAGLVNAKVASDYLPMDIFHILPELEFQHGSARQLCPITGVSPAHPHDITHLDRSHLYDWAHPLETRTARERCAMPAPDPDHNGNIGQTSVEQSWRNM